MKFAIKKILSTVLAVILLITVCFSFNVDYSSAETIPEYIRIGLKYGNSTANEYEVSFDNGIRLGVGDNDEFNELVSFEDINRVLICRQSEDIQLIGTTDSGETVTINDGYEDANCIMPYDYEDDGEDSGIVNFENNRYRGGIMFNALSSGVTIINYLPLEEYLYGVINGELNKSNPIEALKAQAVAARSFAICKLGTHKSYGFDLCATTHCQVYKGYGDEYMETTRAVDETKGETTIYDEKTVPAFFFKNSGGYTQSIEDVWGSKSFNYLKAVEDEYSPRYPWNYTYDFFDLSSKLSSAGFDVGSVTEVSISKRNQSGAVEELRFIGTNGTATLQKSKIRSVLGATVIKSTMFTFGDADFDNTDMSRDNKIEENHTYVLSGEQNGIVETSDFLYVMNDSGIANQISKEDIYICDGKETKLNSNLSESDNLDNNDENTNFNSNESASGGNVTFTGLGYGHGIGMPQDSAVEMAKKGFTYDEILKYYYTDITID